MPGLAGAQVAPAMHHAGIVVFLEFGFEFVFVKDESPELAIRLQAGIQHRQGGVYRDGQAVFPKRLQSPGALKILACQNQRRQPAQAARSPSSSGARHALALQMASNSAWPGISSSARRDSRFRRSQPIIARRSGIPGRDLVDFFSSSCLRISLNHLRRLKARVTADARGMERSFVPRFPGALASLVYPGYAGTHLTSGRFRSPGKRSAPGE